MWKIKEGKRCVAMLFYEEGIQTCKKHTKSKLSDMDRETCRFFQVQVLKAASSTIEIDGNFSVAKWKLIVNAEKMR